MLFPGDYRQWIFLSAGRGMSYSPMAMDQPAPPFDNVFVDRAAYRHFLGTGTWSDGTVLVLEIRGGTSHGSILQGGAFQTGEPLGIEVHVKDTPRFGGDGWAFFGFDANDPKPSDIVPREASCYACHEANTAVDRTFVQFYPTLLPIARAKGTLTRAYLEREAGESGAAAH
ncbi:MAG TPA: cytochrome P460 family protein [Croceibacterium sp.]